MRWLIITNTNMSWNAKDRMWFEGQSQATRFKSPRDAMLSLISTRDSDGMPTEFKCEIHVVPERN